MVPYGSYPPEKSRKSNQIWLFLLGPADDYRGCTCALMFKQSRSKPQPVFETSPVHRFFFWCVCPCFLKIMHQLIIVIAISIKNHLFWPKFRCPDALCMKYVPTFGPFLGWMLVNIPYMERLGCFVSAGMTYDHPCTPGKKADQRKEWISRCSGEEYVDHSQPTLTLDAAR